MKLTQLFESTDADNLMRGRKVRYTPERLAKWINDVYKLNGKPVEVAPTDISQTVVSGVQFAINDLDVEGETQDTIEDQLLQILKQALIALKLPDPVQETRS